MRRGAVFVLRCVTPRSFPRSAVGEKGGELPQRPECTTNAATRRRYTTSCALKDRRSVFGQITCYKLLVRSFFEKTDGDFRRFRMGTGTSRNDFGQSFPLSLRTPRKHAAKTAEGKEKKGELCGANWGLLTRNWGIFRGFGLRIGRKRSIYCTSCTINHTNVAQILYFCR